MQVIRPLAVRMDLCINSDHVSVFIEIDIEIIEQERFLVKRGSEKVAEFVKQCGARLNTLPQESIEYTSHEMVEKKGDWIEYVFDSTWKANIKKCKSSKHAKL